MIKNNFFKLTAVGFFTLALCVAAVLSVNGATTPADIYRGADLYTIVDNVQNTVAIIAGEEYTTFTATGSDPYLYLRDTTASESDCYIAIKYRTSYACNGQIYFASAEPSVTISWNGSGEWSTVIVNANDAGTNWTNKNIFRFDPLASNSVNVSGYSIDIAYIAFFSSQSDAASYLNATSGENVIPTEEYVSPALTFTSTSYRTSVKSCSSTVDAVAIPEKYNGKTVTYLSNGAFTSATSLRIVYIPETITGASKTAFSSSLNCVIAGIDGSYAETVAKNAGLEFIAVTDPSLFTYTFTSEYKATITGYTGDETSITLPPFFMGYKVTSVAEGAFEDSSLVSVRSLYSMEFINNSAFKNSTSLSNVVLSETVNTIGRSSFAGCTSLSSVELGSVTSIPEFAFLDCASLAEVTLPSTLKTIEVRAFAETSLTDITIPASVTYVNQYAFLHCKELKAITVEEGNTVYASQDGLLYDHLFTSVIICPEGKSGNVALNDMVKTVGRGAFIDCDGITSVELAYASKIEAMAFYDCDGLTDLVLPQTVSCIVYPALTQCENLVVNCYINTKTELYCKQFAIPYKIIYSEFILGDANGDLIVSAKDLVRIKRYINDAGTSVIFNAADINGDGVIDEKDLQLLSQMICK